MWKRTIENRRMVKKRCFLKSISIILLVIGVNSFSGCMQGTEDGANEKVEVSMSGYLAPSTGVYSENMAERGEERLEYDTQSEKWFEELYPKTDIVKVEWDFSPESYLAKAEGNTLPTVYYVPMTEAYNILKQGYAADITDEYIKRGYYEHTRDFILENISEDGRVYLVPTAIYDVGLSVNMDVYKESGMVAEDETPYQPQTWEETAQLAKKIKDETGSVGFVFPKGGRTAGWMFMPIAWSYGAVFEEYENGRWAAKFNSPECAAALQYIKDLKWKYDVLQDAEITNTSDYRHFVANNRYGFAFADEEGIKRMIDYGMNRDDVGVLTMPAGPVRKVTLVGGGYNVINKNAAPEQVKAAMDWVEYFHRPAKMNENYKKRIDDQLEKYDRLGYLIGIESVGLWEESSETEQYIKQKTREMINVNYNHIKQYNDKSTVEFKLEEPIEAQALYDILGEVINKVLTDENADIAGLLEAAANEFQTKYLDYAN